MWSSAGHEPITSIEFDLGSSHLLNCIQIWNYNQPNRTHQGLGRTNVSIWTPENEWKTVLEDVTLLQAEGTADYDTPTMLSLDNVTAEKIRFDQLQGFAPSGPIGLSAVGFYTERTDQACKPYPKSGQQVYRSEVVNLSWTSGLHAAQQKLYLGTDPQNLSLLGSLDQNGFSQKTLQGCHPDTEYFWRVDSIQADGSVTTGERWSFHTNALIAHWTFDEIEGDVVKDISGHGFDAKVVGNPQWRPSQGHDGGALYLEGEHSHVVLPEFIGSGPAGKTFVIWAHPTEVRRWARFLALGNGQDSDNVLFARFGASQDLTVTTFCEHRSSTRVTAENVLQLNTWQFLAMSLDTQGDVKIYYNGRLVKEGNAGSPIRDIVRRYNYIGRSNYAIDQYYCGMIDDARMYSLILTPEQILELYQNRDLSFSHSGPVLPTLSDMSTEPQAPSINAVEEVSDSSPPTNGWVVGLIIAIVAALILISNGSRRKKV